MKNIYFRFVAFFLALSLAFLHVSVQAGNGLKMISSGTRSASMGGADIANSPDTSSLNINPALITRFDSPRTDVHLGVAYLFGLGHSDQFDSDSISNKTAYLIDTSYASKIDQLPIYWGVGMFLTGGLGVEYDNINTPFSTQDDLTSVIGLINITPSIAYQHSDQLSVGATLIGTYVNAEQKVFPNTSVVDQNNPQRSFFGSQFSDADDFGYGLRAGIQYQANDRLIVGAVYSSQIDLKPQADEYRVNMSAIGLGLVNYRHLELSGINLPQEIGLGLEYKVSNKFLIATDISWLDWSSAVRRSSLVATDPDNPLAPAKINNNQDLNWKDQYVFALGLAYQANSSVEYRAGYNYGRTPVRDETLSPLLSPHAQHHLGLGFGKQFNSRWSADFAAVYVFNEKIDYTNPDLPFGPSEEEGESIQLEITIGYLF